MEKQYTAIELIARLTMIAIDFNTRPEQKAVIRQGADMLEKLTYRVVALENGIEALEKDAKELRDSITTV